MQCLIDVSSHVHHFVQHWFSCFCRQVLQRLEALPGVFALTAYKYVDERGGWPLETYKLSQEAAKYRPALPAAGAKRKSAGESGPDSGPKKSRLSKESGGDEQAKMTSFLNRNKDFLAAILRPKGHKLSKEEETAAKDIEKVRNRAAEITRWRAGLYCMLNAVAAG